MEGLPFPIPPRTTEQYVAALREFIMDHAELNHILLDRRDGNDNQDFTNNELLFAVHQGLSKINMFPPVSRFSVESFPSDTHWTLLIDFSVIRLLETKGILRTRNEMAYQDQGGVTVDFRGKAQEYRMIVDRFYQRAYQELATLKQTMSVESGYGSIASPYSYNHYGW